MVLFNTDFVLSAFNRSLLKFCDVLTGQMPFGSHGNNWTDKLLENPGPLLEKVRLLGHMVVHMHARGDNINNTNV